MKILKKIWNNQNLCVLAAVGIITLAGIGMALTEVYDPFCVLVFVGATFCGRAVWFPRKKKEDVHS